MTPHEEAHWRYQLERMCNWSFDNRYQAPWNTPPAEVDWLREEARFKCHLADAHRRAGEVIV